jgi:Tfp pilus assembly protein PilX
MRRDTTKLSRSARRQQQTQRGVALLTTLLLLMLMTGLSLAMVMSVRSDLLVNGYYRNFRGSFYAADSGLNIARQEFLNQLQGQLLVNPAPGVAPLPAGAAATALNYVNAKYAANTSVGISGSWPESFNLDTTQSSFAPAPGSPTCATTGGTCAAPSSTAVVTYTYNYNYTLASIGHAQNQESATITDRGNLNFIVTLTPATSSSSTSVKTNFAAWGMFINTYNICDGSTLVPGTISGPVFTNGAWNFGTGRYVFTDTVGSVSKTAGYQNGSCQSIAGPSGNGITPTFQQGFQLGQNAVPLPPNDFNQERAVLDGQGTNNTQVQPGDLNLVVKNAAKTPYPSGGAGSGVFLPYATTDSKGNTLPVPQFTGGGIYVQGNASVVLKPGATPTAQVFLITQNGVTTTITVDPAPVSGFPNGQTTMTTPGVGTVNISGVPDMRDPSGNAQSPATMLYVNGNITSLSGPGSGQPALQNGEALTITAAQNVTITGDIKYTNEPVTLAANQIPGTPADTLIPGNDSGQVLGIFTATGNIQLANSQSSGNLEIDASVAAISQNGSGGLVNTGSAINTLNIVGGRIQNTIQNINTTTRNVFFDRRFLNNNFAPPWFPSTTVTPTTVTTVTTEQSSVQSSFQRTNWLFKGTTYQ